jgi:hypothetical protein
MNDLIERLRLGDGTSADHELLLEAADALEALAQPEQEPVAYDKTEMNCFVQDLYDKKMKEGKHGHYETMFHVVHQAIKKVPPQRTWVGLTDEEIGDFEYQIIRACGLSTANSDINPIGLRQIIKAILRKAQEK